ncbi:hypothetical protein Ocin01_08537 [Orchesella cincta]|uniref:Uncharacterized protein n=1 Tax=Orchesella cincta TaxID=48709 RepID=A0A1D2MYL6_ORCCI|nr:hypothetical protein Ocin01_08537 [Orchesella cincta]
MSKYSKPVITCLQQTINAALKRRPMGAQGFHGDTFNQGFGDFDTMKRAYGNLYDEMEKLKRRPEMTKSGFDSDLFNGGFGEFHPMKK